MTSRLVRTPALRISVVLLAVLWYGERAEGCSCGTPPTCATVWDAELVFVGTATQVLGDGGSEQAQFAVEEWVRGERVDQQVTLVSQGVGFSCDYDFNAGVRYLVLASRDANGRWKAGLCGGTLEFPRASSVLEEMHDALRSPAIGAVSGAVSFDRFPDERVSFGQPIVKAPVMLEAPGQRLTTTTDEKGGFLFDRVPSGEYALTVTVPTNATPVRPVRVVVGPRACVKRYIFPDPR